MKLQTLLIVLLFTGNLLAQNTGKAGEVKIKTSAQCDMCKERIEETLAFQTTCCYAPKLNTIKPQGRKVSDVIVSGPGGHYTPRSLKTDPLQGHRNDALFDCSFRNQSLHFILYANLFCETRWESLNEVLALGPS